MIFLFAIQTSTFTLLQRWGTFSFSSEFASSKLLILLFPGFNFCADLMSEPPQLVLSISSLSDWNKLCLFFHKQVLKWVPKTQHPYLPLVLICLYIFSTYKCLLFRNQVYDSLGFLLWLVRMLKIRSTYGHYLPDICQQTDLWQYYSQWLILFSILIHMVCCLTH